MADEIYETPFTTSNLQTELAVQLADLVPEAIADGKVDIEKLKELLDGDAADSSERFGLFWPGKKRALRAAQEPTTATLKPDFENSKDWDTTQNVFIEGDNLEVLKILQKHYHAKIKLIYIDPPYNTGRDFIYPDNYKEGLDTYLKWTRQINDEGKKVRTNADTEGRYHSNWLNMMYPRLKLARNLLSDDGIVFVSIDDNEYDNLLKLCKEVFGESTYLGTITWLKKRKGSFLSKGIVSMHEYAVAFGRRPHAKLFGGKADELESQPLVKRTNARSVLRFPGGVVKTRIEDGLVEAGVYGEGTSSVILQSEIRIQDGVIQNEFLLEGAFIWSQPYLEAQIARGGRVVINTLGLQPRAFKAPSNDDFKGFSSVFNGVANSATNEDSYEYSTDLFGTEGILDYPKPVNYLKSIIEASTAFDKSGVVLDFFAGSGTTADAVMRLNAADGGTRRYIQVQLPEPTPAGSQARKAGYRTISAIARSRIKLAAQRITFEKAEELSPPKWALDLGFRAYQLADTNFTKWRFSSDIEKDALQQHLLSLRNNTSDDASIDELLTEILLKQGYSLTEAVSPAEIAGLDVRLVRDRDGDVAVLAYLNEHVKPTLEQLSALADESPTRIIVLEDVFQGDDELKTNLAQLAKSKDIELWTA